jgi:hypothetical protein
MIETITISLGRKATLCPPWTKPLRLPGNPVGDAHSVIKSDYQFWHCCYAVEIKLILKAASLLLVKLRAKSPQRALLGA